VNIKNMFWLDIIWFAHIFFIVSIFFPYSVHFISISETCGDNEETIQKATTGSVFQQAVHEVHSTRFIPPWLQPPLH
jgi:poly-D-alanine transfer protein DltD